MKLRIRALRKNKGWTIGHMAEVTGISPGFISQIETGQRLPGPQTLLTLAQTFDVAVPELYDLADGADLLAAIQMFEAILPEDRPAALRALSGFLPRDEAKQ